MNTVWCFLALSIGLVAANPVLFELLKKDVFKKEAQPVLIAQPPYYQPTHGPDGQGAPDLTYGPPETSGPVPVPAPGPQNPTLYFPQKAIIQKPISFYKPVVEIKPYHVPIPTPQFYPVYNPIPYYKPEFVPIHVHTATQKPNKFETLKSTIDGIKSGIASKISGITSGVKDKVETAVSNIKTGVSNKVTGIKTHVSDKVTGIKTGISGKVTGLKTHVSDKVTGVHSTVSGIKSTVSENIGDKITGIKAFGAHVGDVIKEGGVAVGSALKGLKQDLVLKHQQKPHYVLVQGPIPQPPVSPPVQPPTLTYGPPEQPPPLTYGPPEQQ